MLNNWGALSAGLPEDILKAKWAGDFERAQRMIDLRLKDPRLPETLRESLRMEKTILDRLPAEYTLTREAALSQAQERISGMTEEEFDRLELEGELDYIYVLGEKRYYRRVVNTLVKVYPDLAARAGRPFPDKPTQLDDMIARMMQIGRAALRIHMRHTVTIDDEAFTPGETYTVHIPIPMPAAQIRDVRVLTQDEGMIVAPEDQPQRTVCFARKLDANAPFTVEYEYVCDARYADLSKPARGVVYPDATPVRPEDTMELRPHMTFTPYMRSLAAELAGGETDPLKVARRFYDFCTTRIVYSFVRSYLTIENGSEYAAINLKGDCGLQTLCFITLCRIAGIPARWQAGLYVEPGDVGNHDWAQFYVEGYGWFFCDCSFGGSGWRKGNMTRWNFYFGNLDPWRMVSNADYQSDFYPPKKHVRIDPYDNQCGEIETPTRGLTAYECDCDWDILSMEPID